MVNWIIISNIATIITALSAIVALIFAVITIKQHTKAVNMKILENMLVSFSSIHYKIAELHPEIAKHLKMYAADTELFNRIEAFAFFIRKKYIDEDTQDFFSPSIIGFYEDYFRKLYPAIEKDQKSYQEFKKLYHQLKGESL